MVVRMRHVKKLTGRDFRLTLDVVDPERAPWDYGDCVVQIDLHDGLSDHFSNPRGLLKPAFEAYGLSPNERPVGVEARLLWDIGEAVHRYVDRIFEAGILCPFSGPPKPAERPE